MTQQRQENSGTPGGSRDGDGAGDHDEPYRFGGRPRASLPCPFNTRQYARLLVLRSRVREDIDRRAGFDLVQAVDADFDRAAYARPAMRRTWTYSIPSWSVATGSIRMDKVEQLFEQFRARTNSSAASKLDVLLDLDRLSDPRLVPFLLQVLAETTQPAEVRVHIVKRLRNGRLASESRAAVAQAMIELLAAGTSPDLRLQVALALAEFTLCERVPFMLGSLALDVTEPLDLRYSAFTSLERVGPTPESIDILRQLSADETLGRSARSLLSSWKVA